MYCWIYCSYLFPNSSSIYLIYIRNTYLSYYQFRICQILRSFTIHLFVFVFQPWIYLSNQQTLTKICCGCKDSINNLIHRFYLIFSFYPYLPQASKLLKFVPLGYSFGSSPGINSLAGNVPLKIALSLPSTCSILPSRSAKTGGVPDSSWYCRILCSLVSPLCVEDGSGSM